MKKYDDENEIERPKQVSIVKEIRKWGIIITILLAIPVAIEIFMLIRPMFGP